VEDLVRPPAYYAGFYLIYGGDRWVRSIYVYPQSNVWSFHYGTLDGSTFTQIGETTGDVNEASGTISIELPADTLPPRPADGTARDISVSGARSYFLPESVLSGVMGERKLIDDAVGGTCIVTLYEKDPALP
jgi:hypothetical protein